MQKFKDISHFKPRLPKAVREILVKLESAGFSAYIVGGAVRDMLFRFYYGSEYALPTDYDIATDATPSEVMALFKHTIPTGLKHGTITIVRGKAHYEVTTFRIESAYSNARAPDSVRFSKSLDEDIKRRDFTINGLALSADSQLIDYVNGLSDLQSRQLRAIGNASERFMEDALRILRALRFSATFGFEVESSTSKAMYANKARLSLIAKERIKIELDKMLCGKGASAVWRQYKAILAEIVPEAKDIKLVDFYALDLALREIENALLQKVVSKTRTLNTLWAYILWQLDSSEAILDRLKFDNRAREHILGIIWLLNMDINNESLPRLIVRLNGRRIGTKSGKDSQKSQDSFKHTRLNGEVLSDVIALLLCANSAKRAQILAMKERYVTLINSDMPLSVRDLAISGKDLLSLGFKQGAEISQMLESSLDLVMQGKVENDKVALIWAIKALKNI